jgi:hypothetical protein
MARGRSVPTGVRHKLALKIQTLLNQMPRNMCDESCMLQVRDEFRRDYDSGRDGNPMNQVYMDGMGREGGTLVGEKRKRDVADGEPRRRRDHREAGGHGGPVLATPPAPVAELPKEDGGDAGAQSEGDAEIDDVGGGQRAPPPPPPQDEEEEDGSAEGKEGMEGIEPAEDERGACRSWAEGGAGDDSGKDA